MKKQKPPHFERHVVFEADPALKDRVNPQPPPREDAIRELMEIGRTLQTEH